MNMVGYLTVGNELVCGLWLTHDIIMWQHVCKFRYILCVFNSTAVS